jgi:hypothetical protein
MMSMEDHPTIDASGNLKINEKHLMVFLHADGFNERSLDLKIFVTKSYEIEVYLSAFKKGNKYGDFTSKYTTKEIPAEIITFLDELSQLESPDFGYVYLDDLIIEHAQRQEILFNHYEKTLGFYVSSGKTVEEKNFKTNFGKGFYHFYEFLNNWKEELYEDFNKS